MEHNGQYRKTTGNTGLPRISVLDQDMYETTDNHENHVAAMAKHEAQYIAIAFNEFVARIEHTFTAHLMQPALIHLADAIQEGNTLSNYPASPDLQVMQEMFLKTVTALVDQPTSYESFDKVRDEDLIVPF